VYLHTIAGGHLLLVAIACIHKTLFNVCWASLSVSNEPCTYGMLFDIAAPPAPPFQQGKAENLYVTNILDTRVHCCSKQPTYHHCCNFILHGSGFPRMLSHSASGHALASSHPNLGQLGAQQRVPFQYPGQPPSSLNGSLGYSANLSSAGSDRASPSSVIGRTNLAAQMGFGSNPNLQSLDQLQMQLPQRNQLNWQQQLLAQQHQQQSYDSYQYSGGFQNRHGHHLPAVPSWQDPANQNPGQSPRAAAHPAPANPLTWAGAQSLQGSYPMQPDSFSAGPGRVSSENISMSGHGHFQANCSASHV